MTNAQEPAAADHTSAEASAATGASRADMLRSLGLGLITGAADDDPSAIGTYAAAGAAFGPALLWTAPAAFPMMFAVAYLSSKVGRVTGQGLFSVIMSLFGFNPMKALVVAGIAQGVSTPLLMIVVMRITGDREIMGASANTVKMNVLGWTTVAVMLMALTGLLYSLTAPIFGG